MPPKKIFWIELAGFVTIFFCYGLVRLRLGIDMTDEGAYLAWPLRVHLGEAPFSSELLTLIRPVEVYLSFFFKLAPAITLYEFRMVGWITHLLSFSVLSLFLFRLSHAPLRSLLIASVPFFVCHVFGLASPSYNTLSSDFLLIALSLWGLAGVHQRHGLFLGVVLGGALFVATFAHPGLGLLAAAILAHELWRGDLRSNCRRGQLTAPNIGLIIFISCWLVFLVYFWSSGALAHWVQRMALSRATTTFDGSLLRFLIVLLVYPFAYSRVALALSSVVLLAAWSARRRSRSADPESAATGRMLLGFVLVAALSITFSLETYFLPICFVMVSLVAAGIHLIPSASPLASSYPGVRLLILASCLASLIYASLTYYFFTYRSWIAGMQGLPFAFSAGMALLMNVNFRRLAILDLLVTVSLALVVLCAVRDHYRNIYRDETPPALNADFNIPKLRHIKSTKERVQALDALYEYLHHDIKYGEPLLAFDDCPMLYYIFDARPAYGLAWAVRYGQRPAVLEKLNEEVNSQPLPRFAIRTLVDLSNVVWRTAPRTNYDHYPLNETLLAHYALERTIFPFEIWQLKTPEKASRRNGSP